VKKPEETHSGFFLPLPGESGVAKSVCQQLKTMAMDSTVGFATFCWSCTTVDSIPFVDVQALSYSSIAWAGRFSEGSWQWMAG
jgi:hypothetical protein